MDVGGVGEGEAHAVLDGGIGCRSAQSREAVESGTQSA